MDMNPNRLAELIVKPDSCSREELSEIAGMARKYPYSSVIKILAAKITSITGHELKERLLTRAAIATPDRLRLKEYMTSSGLFDEYNFIRTYQAGKEPRIAPGPKIREWPDRQESEVYESETTVISEPLKQTREEKAPEISDSAEIAGTEVSEDQATLIQEKTLEVLKPPPPEEPVSKKEHLVNKEPERDKISAFIPQPEVGEGKVRQTYTGSHIADEILENIEGWREIRKRFEKLLSEEIKQETPAAQPEQRPPVPVADNIDDPFREIIKPLRKKRSSKKLAKEEQDLLISKFIETESENSKAVKPERVKQPSDEDLSLSSTEINDEMVTETLANILVSQGKLEKAIDIYRKLIWKLPQKKAYFAAQIELLKERIPKS